MKNLMITPTSIIKRTGLRRVDISACTERAAHYTLTVSEHGQPVLSCDVALPGGEAQTTLWLDLPRRTFEAYWTLTDRSGQVAAEQVSLCEKPREWKLFIMVSSHTDIGLHNAQYIQRHNSVKFIDMAAALCDATSDRPADSQYRYVMEGAWFWNNYLEDRSPEESRRILEEYIQQGKMGVYAGVAGNHIHTYGWEEMCRSAYSRTWLQEHGVTCKTMTMIDNNGLSWAMIQPYADAGYENILFAPNHWNPLPSTVWKRDTTVSCYEWNPEAGGGGARIDMRYGSHLPMLFWWEGKAGRKLLVWGGNQYPSGGTPFGLQNARTSVACMEDKMAPHLTRLEKKVPYDVWLVCHYGDDQEPGLGLCNNIAAWNEVYEFPRIQMLGDPDEPFDLIRERFGDQIPTLRGDMTGGWYQHPVAAADLLAAKLNTDRALANAEKVAAIAALYGKDYTFPADDFNRAWAGLVMNDEHSYGTSSYSGRKVFETWMGHRDWIEKASNTASTETARALQALGANIPGGENRVLLFNPTASARHHKGVALPPFGYRVVQAQELQEEQPVFVPCPHPPVIENAYYRITFAENGAMAEILDKELNRPLCSGNCNELLYTQDNHKTFHRPGPARFAVSNGLQGTVVEIRSELPELGAELLFTVTLPAGEKRIDLDDRILHARDMVNTNRYYRYLYAAFPFDVPGAKRICQLGGCEAEYGVDVTGHCTDVYMAAHEYACADSADGSFGVGLIQLDSQLVEFDHIHPDKTDFANTGDGSAVYAYLANDWLQRHLPGGSALNFHFRYSIVSYSGNHTAAGLAFMAEQRCEPVLESPLSAHTQGSLPSDMCFFASDARLIGMKPARDGRGLIARLFGSECPVHIESTLGDYESATIDERIGGHLCAGFSTLRIHTAPVPLRPVEEADPLAIGSVETGLITHPRAGHSETEDTLYLLWGKCREKNISHYELWRDGVLLAEVEPEEYVVGRYVDTGLARNTRYTYQVRAVAADGHIGPFSEVFEGLTRE